METHTLVFRTVGHVCVLCVYICSLLCVTVSVVNWFCSDYEEEEDEEEESGKDWDELEEEAKKGIMFIQQIWGHLLHSVVCPLIHSNETCPIIMIA